MRALIIKTSSLGDVIHTLPAITDAAEQLDIHFDWVVEESFAEVPTWHKNVDRVIPVALRRWRKSPLSVWRSQEWRHFKQEMRRHSYEAVIDAQGLIKSAWLTRYAEGPSFGLDKKSAREPLASRFYQRSIKIAKQQHAVERVRQLFAAALGYTVPQRIGDYQVDRSRLGANPCTGEYLVFLHGTTWPTKHWPEHYWQALAKSATQADFKVLIPWGNATEKKRAEQISTCSDNIEVLPRMGLSTLATILADAKAVVSVDTGLAHLCAALDTPNLTLYGPTQPQLVGTYGKNQQHLEARLLEKGGQKESFADLMQQLTPELVWRYLSAITETPRP
ncbi:MAG: lipopolysaccharide heptosyltransferase I [Pseudomonadales bacterium]|nr:lipopolysaccharide heptosyltransferase I [Pseudomonadales bacterium]